MTETDKQQLEKIPADKIVVMTDIFYKAFQASGCSPICHCCVKDLKPTIKFKLATVETIDTLGTNSVNSGVSSYAGDVESREVMLCDECTVEDMNNMTEKRKRIYQKYRDEGGGC